MSVLDNREQYSLEAVRQRLQQSALRLWGIRNLDSLDPFIRLLMDALAGEVHRVGNEFIIGEIRLLEKLAGLLTPDLLVLPRPAHAIAKAHPVEPDWYLPSTTNLIYPKRYASKPLGELDAKCDVAFSSVGTVRLVDAQIRYLASGHTLRRVGGELDSAIRATAPPQRRLSPHTLWIGLQLNPEVDSLHRLSFCFDWPLDYPKSDLFSLLGVTQWFCQGRKIPSHHGLIYGNEEEAPSPLDNHILAEYELNRLLEADINSLYTNQFVSLIHPKHEPLGSILQAYPPLFSEHFNHADLEELSNERLLWLRVTFPASFSEEILAKTQVHLNAFPVFNRKLYKTTYRLRIIHNIIPLRVDPLETFLTVHSLLDSYNRLYTPFPYRQQDQLQNGSFAVRRGGVERFDARDAKEHLHYLLDIIRDDSVAFSSYGQDIILTLVRQLTQQVDAIEERIRQSANQYQDMNNYIVFKPIEEGDTMNVQYWSTNGDFANQIRAGSELLQYHGTTIQSGSAQLLTTSTGGQARLGTAHKVDAYKHALMSHQRIVTLEDIKTFCQYELGARIRSVHIKKGVAIGNHPKEGLMRTVDVWLHPTPEFGLTDEEWQVLISNLQAKLVSRSGHITRYRVFLATE